MTLNTVVLTAIPRPSVTMAINANPGALRRERIAYFMSCQKPFIVCSSSADPAKWIECNWPSSAALRRPS